MGKRAFADQICEADAYGPDYYEPDEPSVDEPSDEEVNAKDDEDVVLRSVD